MDETIKAGIKFKYLNKAFPNIYIHRFPLYKLNNLPAFIQIIEALKNKHGQNMILNQIETMPNIYNHHVYIKKDDLAFPIYCVFNSIRDSDAYGIYSNNTIDVISFLNHEFNFIPPSLLQEATGKLILCKKVHKVRKKVWQTLVSLHKERHGMIQIFNESLAPNKNLDKIEKCLNDPKTQKEYQAFFITMKEIMIPICCDALHKIMRDAAEKRLLIESEVRIADLMNVYRYLLFNNWMGGDLHVLCTLDAEWDITLLQNVLSNLLDRSGIIFDNFDWRRTNQCDACAEAIIKTVVH